MNRLTRVLLAGAAIVMSANSAWAAEEGTVRILAPWQSGGQVYRVEPNKLLFQGQAEGIMYIESGEGALDAALFVCPSRREISLMTGRSKPPDDASSRVRAAARCLRSSPAVESPALVSASSRSPVEPEDSRASQARETCSCALPSLRLRRIWRAVRPSQARLVSPFGRTSATRFPGTDPWRYAGGWAESSDARLPVSVSVRMPVARETRTPRDCRRRDSMQGSV